MNQKVKGRVHLVGATLTNELERQFAEPVTTVVAGLLFFRFLLFILI